MLIISVIPSFRGKNNYGSAPCACDDKSIPIHPIRRLLETGRRGRQGRQGGGGLDPPRRDGRDVRAEHNLRTPRREGGQGVFGEVLRRPSDDPGPDQIRGRLRGRRMRRDHGSLRGRGGHRGRHREDQSQGAQGRRIGQSRDAGREDRPVPPDGGHRTRDDCPPRVRRAVVHIRLRPEDRLCQGVGREEQSVLGGVRGRRRQRRDRQGMRGGRCDGARGRLVPVQEGRHGADDIVVAGPRTQCGVPRWE